MPTDDIAAGDGGAGPGTRVRTLRSRIQMPVGKVIALVAMPSAALLGLGIGSPLAKADTQPPENPFQDRPCVTAPDEEAADTGDPEEAGDEAEEDGGTEETAPGDGSPEPEPTGEDAAPGDAGETEAPEADGGAEESGEAEEPAEPQAPADTEEPEEPGESEEPQEEETFNPWDPLGIGQGLSDLGDALEDIFVPGGDEEDAEAGESGETGATEEPQEPEAPADTQEPDESEEPEAPADTGEPEESEESEAPADSEPDEEADGTAEDTGGTDGAGDEDTEGTDAGGADDPFAEDEQGREPYPCPTEQHVAGTDETPPIVLPDDPWYLDATYLTLRGLDYHGVVNVPTSSGQVKQVLKFTVESVDIGDLHQIVDEAGSSTRYHVTTEQGSNSTFRNGTVTMYTERLEGNLFGVIPIVFDPEHEPPLDIPIAYFTDVFVTQAGQFGGDLTMTGMNIFTTEDGPTTGPED
ncbi:hypothetical protein [Streptomyces sp. RFCAC02]|uniref:hypothetical protein n=1 Tax=Streptomyces sp. RFCAC02 TaxID=2499143 RepID=UPI0010211B89|nr:hypothetical protein [Streptomyces sp. RFCAC02]